MRAYKAFNSRLQATMGHGTFQFEPGKTYVEGECKCANNGFHCAENPLDTLDYYHGMDTRFFIVEAAGDINQDGKDSRIACTEITLVKEISRIQLAALACQYLLDHPDRGDDGGNLERDKGRCMDKGDFIIVRGKHPQAAGVQGAYIFLVKEKKGSREIEGIYPLEIDGKEYREDTWYGLRGGRICAKKN